MEGRGVRVGAGQGFGEGVGVPSGGGTVGVTVGAGVICGAGEGDDGTEAGPENEKSSRFTANGESVLPMTKTRTQADRAAAGETLGPVVRR